MKTKFRQMARKRLKTLGQADLEEKSLKLSQTLFKELHQHFSSGSVVGCFVPIGLEPKWYLAFDNSFEFAIPRLGDQQMEYIHSTKNFIIEHNGDYLAADLQNNPTIVVPDVLLIPGLAFALNGTRLGRGKGYFDRYLEKYTGKKIGIGFEIQIFDEIPSDKWDQKVDQIITEKEIYNG